jgi:hypothetical protein
MGNSAAAYSGPGILDTLAGPDLCRDRERRRFCESFHGDTRRGVGASHQTGWTGVTAKLLQLRRRERDQPESEES